MTSLAWAHRERVRKELAAKAAKADAAKAEKLEIQKMAENKDKHELLLIQLEADCKRLSELPQGSAREPLKRELVKSYLPLVQAYIKGDQEFRNEILTQVMIWLFDLGEIDEALKLAKIAIEQNQPMPKRYTRNARTFVADAVLEWADIQKVNGGSIEPYFSEMFDKVLDWQIHDTIKIKYLKLAANEAQAAGDVEKALELCVRAEKIDPKKSKVKTLKSDLEKAVAAKKEAEKHEAAKPAKAEEGEADKAKAANPVKAAKTGA